MIAKSEQASNAAINSLHYMVTLFAVALLSLFGQILIQRSLNESSNDAHVVNFRVGKVCVAKN